MLTENETVDLFGTWIKTKTGTFDYIDVKDCCYAQFLKENNICSNPYVGGLDYRGKREHYDTVDSKSCSNIQFSLVAKAFENLQVPA